MPVQRLAAVLLAAGASCRFGSPKQLVEIGGTALVRRVALATLDCGAEVIVVTGAYADQVVDALRGLPLVLVHNPRWEAGMGESIACGFRELSLRPEPPSSSLLCVVDQPLVGAEQLRRLIERQLAEPQRIVVSDYGGTVGPPCLFPATFYAELTRLSGSAGARKVLERHPEAVVTVSVPEAALDIDQPEDLLRALAVLADSRDGATDTTH